MPYTKDTLPDAVKGLPQHAMSIWMSAYNAAYEQYKGDEAKCAAVAWAAVKKAGYAKDADGKWVKSGMSDPMIEREAKLFEAGDYENTHGISVTEDDLDLMIANFDEVPIRIEHTDTAFDGALGCLKSIWRKGKELFGKIAFQKAAWVLAEAAGAKKLSVGISRAKDKLVEVSLVLSPRVASARVFGSEIVCFDAGDTGDFLSREDVIERFAALWSGRDERENSNDTGGETQMADVEKKLETPETVDFKAELEQRDKNIEDLKNANAERDKQIADLQFANRQKDARTQIDALKRAGKIVPAAEGLAEVILLHGSETIEFSDGDKPVKATVAEAFGKFLEAQPAVVNFSESGKSGDADSVQFSQAEIDAAAKMGVSREELVKYATN